MKEILGGDLVEKLPKETSARRNSASQPQAHSPVGVEFDGKGEGTKEADLHVVTGHEAVCQLPGIASALYVQKMPLSLGQLLGIAGLIEELDELSVASGVVSL